MLKYCCALLVCRVWPQSGVYRARWDVVLRWGVVWELHLRAIIDYLISLSCQHVVCAQLATYLINQDLGSHLAVCIVYGGVLITSHAFATTWSVQPWSVIRDPILPFCWNHTHRATQPSAKPHSSAHLATSRQTGGMPEKMISTALDSRCNVKCTPSANE